MFGLSEFEWSKICEFFFLVTILKIENVLKKVDTAFGEKLKVIGFWLKLEINKKYHHGFSQ